MVRSSSGVVRSSSGVSLRLDFGERRPAAYRRGLRLATPAAGTPRGPETYRILDLKRRRAQMRARRLLGLMD
jgi:hypothetical protein